MSTVVAAHGAPGMRLDFATYADKDMRRYNHPQEFEPAVIFVNPEGAPPAPEGEAFLDALRDAAEGGNMKAQAELDKRGLTVAPPAQRFEENLQRIVQEELEAVLAETLTKAEKEKKAKLKGELDDLEHK